MPRKIVSPRPRITMDTARPSPAPIRARRWRRATYTPRPSRTRVRIGSTHLRPFRTRYPCCALTRYLAENRASVGLILGSLVTIVSPRLARSRLTTLMNGPRFSTTWLLLIVTAPLPCPDSALTSWAWTARLTWTHKLATCGLAMILATWVWTNPFTELAIWSEKLFSSEPILVSPLCVSSVAAWVVSPFTLSRVVIWRVMSSVIARWMEGSWISGATLATYRSVLDTWLAVHTATTDSGARMQPMTMSTTATGARHPLCLRRAGAAGWSSPP